MAHFLFLFFWGWVSEHVLSITSYREMQINPMRCYLTPVGMTKPQTQGVPHAGALVGPWGHLPTVGENASDLEATLEHSVEIS